MIKLNTGAMSQMRYTFSQLRTTSQRVVEQSSSQNKYYEAIFMNTNVYMYVYVRFQI